MIESRKCEIHDVEIKNLKKAIEEIKEENKSQNKELKEVFKHFSTISEAIVEIKIFNKQISETLPHINNDIQELKKEVFQEKLNDRWDFKTYLYDKIIPTLISMGVVFFILKIMGVFK